MDFLAKALDKWNALVAKAMEKWNIVREKASPIWKRVKEIYSEVAKVVKVVADYVYKMRKIVLAIPVALGTVILAIYNEANLPAIVGLDLQNNGDFNIQVVRELAVLGPVVITSVCLLLMFCSRRLLTPWLVSMFTLLVPVFILITNTFPA